MHEQDVLVGEPCLPLIPGAPREGRGEEILDRLLARSRGTVGNLDQVLVRPPIIASISDMMLGRALDTTFNNATPPFGCQAGGGNLCASSSLKLVAPVTTAFTPIGFPVWRRPTTAH